MGVVREGERGKPKAEKVNFTIVLRNLSFMLRSEPVCVFVGEHVIVTKPRNKRRDNQLVSSMFCCVLFTKQLLYICENALDFGDKFV